MADSSTLVMYWEQSPRRFKSCLQLYSDERGTMKNCLLCNAELNPKQNQQKYCSSSCAAKVNNKFRKKKKYCPQCSELITNNSSIYCSLACFHQKGKDEFIAKWKSDPNSTNTKHGISRTIVIYLKEQAGWRCQSPNCAVPDGWSEVNPTTGTVPVEIDHIDGNSWNNHPDNLIVLCPSCHALTPNYRALNKESGRTHRSKYKQYI